MSDSGKAQDEGSFWGSLDDNPWLDIFANNHTFLPMNSSGANGFDFFKPLNVFDLPSNFSNFDWLNDFPINAADGMSDSSKAQDEGSSWDSFGDDIFKPLNVLDLPSSFSNNDWLNDFPFNVTDGMSDSGKAQDEGSFWGSLDDNPWLDIFANNHTFLPMNSSGANGDDFFKPIKWFDVPSNFSNYDWLNDFPINAADGTSDSSKAQDEGSSWESFGDGFFKPLEWFDVPSNFSDNSWLNDFPFNVTDGMSDSGKAQDEGSFWGSFEDNPWLDIFANNHTFLPMNTTSADSPISPFFVGSNTSFDFSQFNTSDNFFTPTIWRPFEIPDNMTSIMQYLTASA
ncbi:uncharacterized protein [Palaemon carinicauda]|uniref:uncharacterized protein isoform X2 n=1 Tax=Palaemon carinicauda TaxID=392227 RepID=UPI0035B65013